MHLLLKLHKDGSFESDQFILPWEQSKPLLRTWRYFKLVIVCMNPPRLQGSFISSFFVGSAIKTVIWFLKTHSDMSNYGMYVCVLIGICAPHPSDG